MIKVDEAFASELLVRQATHLRESLEHHFPPEGGHRYLSDDGNDYLSANLELTESIRSAWFEGDYPAIEAWLNMTGDEHQERAEKHYGLMAPLFDHYACDGISDFLSKLDCAATREED